MERISVAIVMTVFNRMEKTEKCINSILAENKDGKYKFSFFITNDGSTDNTDYMSKEYQKNYPDVNFNVLYGTGNLYWNKGMFLAYGAALHTKVDYYLWVNNDVIFASGFLEGLLIDSAEAKKSNKLSLICGAVSFMDSNEWSYGGAKNLSKTNPYKRKKIIPNGSIQECDCINGNCLLIPYETGIYVGNLDERYEHGFGDFDYGYKLKSCGGQPYVASKYVGCCNRNSIKGTWIDPSVPFVDRIKKKNRPTGQPYKSHKIFLKKWFPKMWLYYLWKPYIRIAITSLKYKVWKK